jgi:S-adenosylmethionine synthetase
MTGSSYLFTSESVSEGHPDKIADRISDTILDAFLAEDPFARVACETFVTHNLVVVAGEFGTQQEGLFERLEQSAPGIVREALRAIGYRADFPGIDPDVCEVRIVWNRQSVDIDRGVTHADGNLGAGDQGLVFGYACDETPELMPLPLALAHRLVERQAQLRKSGELPWLRPDAKSQVTVRYEDGKPAAIETVVLSTQHAPDIDAEQLREAVIESIIRPVLPEALCEFPPTFLVNPTGRFVVGGPVGDTGLTGRKIIVDTYGGACPHGGGAFSGKDPTKIDRSAAYAARHIAKNLVAAGIAKRCTVQIAYAIGVVQPVSLYVDFHGTGKEPEEDVSAKLLARYDLSPRCIIDRFNLRRPIYAQTSAYGHFGRDSEQFPWERVDGRVSIE